MPVPTAYEPAGASDTRRAGRAFSVRAWSVRHARFHEVLYRLFADLLLRFEWLWRRMGYTRTEKLILPVERTVKGVLFDCRMCGECLLTSTGMSCPMNCPKNMRNGPCGGVRANGNCEVEPDMKCVWVEAWEGSRRMAQGDLIHVVQKPVDHGLRGTSAWLRVTARAAAERAGRRT